MTEEGGTVWYVLSQSQSEFKKLSDTLISKYKTLQAGDRPANTAGKWELLVPIMKSMYKVVQAGKHKDHPLSECPSCEANPFKLICIWGCPMFNQCGCCSHTLTVGHVLVEHLPAGDRPSVANVRYMCEGINTGEEDTLTGATKAPRKALEPGIYRKKGVYNTKNSKRYDPNRKKKKSPTKKPIAKKTAAKKPTAKPAKPAAKPAKPAAEKKKPAPDAPISQTKPTRKCRKRCIVSDESDFSDSD